jgi:hypothetical protein
VPVAKMQHVTQQHQSLFTGSIHVPVAKMQHVTQQHQSLFTGSTHVPVAKMQHVVRQRQPQFTGSIHVPFAKKNTCNSPLAAQSSLSSGKCQQKLLPTTMKIARTVCICKILRVHMPSHLQGQVKDSKEVDAKKRSSVHMQNTNAKQQPLQVCRYLQFGSCGFF